MFERLTYVTSYIICTMVIEKIDIEIFELRPLFAAKVAKY